MRKRPDSRAGRARAADQTLRRLLRTPKTRAGLIAAVVGRDITRNYVYGWLSERTRDGTLAVLKSAGQRLYQITASVVQEQASEGQYPSWLEPRQIPLAAARRLYIDGELATDEPKEKEEQPCD